MLSIYLSPIVFAQFATACLNPPRHNTLYIGDLKKTYLVYLRGTGMIVSSILFAPIWGGSLGICSVSCLLYGMVRSTILQQSSKGSCSLLVSGHNLRADCQWRTLVPSLNCSANAALASVQACAGVGRGSLK